MERMDCVREPLAYLYRIAANVVADFVMAERRRQHVASDSEAVDNWVADPSQAVHDDVAERLSMERQLEQALEQLPSAQAAALIYHYQGGLSCDEIAEKLGLSTTSVDKYLTRAKARMRLILCERQP
jgi:RNA polymerase sigma-70 factor (ECF subfamily)